MIFKTLLDFELGSIRVMLLLRYKGLLGKISLDS